MILYILKQLQCIFKEVKFPEEKPVLRYFARQNLLKRKEKIIFNTLTIT